MGKVIHALGYDPAPNESDTEGDSYLACGLDVADHISKRLSEVTCKKCVKENQHHLDHLTGRDNKESV